MGDPAIDLNARSQQVILSLERDYSVDQATDAGISCLSSTLARRKRVRQSNFNE